MTSFPIPTSPINVYCAHSEHDTPTTSTVAAVRRYTSTRHKIGFFRTSCVIPPSLIWYPIELHQTSLIHINFTKPESLILSLVSHGIIGIVSINWSFLHFYEPKTSYHNYSYMTFYKHCQFRFLKYYTHIISHITSYSEFKITQAPTKSQENLHTVSCHLANIQPCQAVQAKLKNNANLWCVAWRQELSRQAVSGENPKTPKSSVETA